MTAVAQELIDVEVSELISAVRCVRTEDRARRRNGYRRGTLVPGATTMEAFLAASGCPNAGGMPVSREPRSTSVRYVARCSHSLCRAESTVSVPPCGVASPNAVNRRACRGHGVASLKS